ncbi:MAG: GTPase [Cyanobacteria bacterium J06588_4]
MTKVTPMELIFVYNADSGFINTLMDIGHKALDPDTYQCNLCSLTFGIVGEHKKWRQFREESSAEMRFLHRDEFEQEYQQEFDYPVILKSEPQLEVAISRSELEDIPTLENLIKRVNQVSGD